MKKAKKKRKKKGVKVWLTKDSGASGYMNIHLKRPTKQENRFSFGDWSSEDGAIRRMLAEKLINLSKFKGNKIIPGCIYFVEDKKCQKKRNSIT